MSHPKRALERSSYAMLEAFLLTSSLLLVVGMCAALMTLASLRVRNRGETMPAQAPEQAPDPRRPPL